MAEHYPTQSVAVLAEQGKVTGWSQPESNATGAETGVGAEIDALGDAQVVSSTAPEFVDKPEDPIELQKGPKKKYIDNPNDAASEEQGQQGQQGSYQQPTEASGAPDAGMGDFFGDDAGGDATAPTTTENTNNNNNDNDNNNNGVSFGGPDTTVTSTYEAPSNTGNEDFFAGIDDNGNDDGTHPTNATMISLPTVGGGDQEDEFDQDDYGQNNVDESKQQEATVLSLWQEERRKLLQERIEKEKATQRELEEQAEKDKQEFIEKRNERISKARDDALAREKDIKLDYDAVYKNGTIWEQVAKLIDLQNNDETVKRMRDLIIDLKNQGKN